MLKRVVREPKEMKAQLSTSSSLLLSTSNISPLSIFPSFSSNLHISKLTHLLSILFRPEVHLPSQPPPLLLRSKEERSTALPAFFFRRRMIERTNYFDPTSRQWDEGENGVERRRSDRRRARRPSSSSYHRLSSFTDRLFPASINYIQIAPSLS